MDVFLLLKSTSICAYVRHMVHDIINRVRETLQQPGMSKARLATIAGLHRNTLRGVEAPDWNPTAATLSALEPHVTEPRAPEKAA